jgi:ABC-2 type transport system ATP-binding protein
VNDTVFSLNNFSVSYDGGLTFAVDGIHLRLQAGRALALLGANGAGKSSLITGLLGIHHATTTGSNTLLDMRLPLRGRAIFRRVGFVADGMLPPFHWTVRRYLDYVSGLYPTWDKALEAELLAMLELPETRTIAVLSRGQKMKAVTIGALAFRPEFVALDEPFDGLDPLAREELMDMFGELRARSGWTMLLSSHDLLEVQRLCDDVAILDGGKIAVHESLPSLLGRCRRIQWEDGGGSPPPPGWMDTRGSGTNRRAIHPHYLDDTTTLSVLEKSIGAPVRNFVSNPADLHDILIAHLRESRAQRHAKTPRE